MTTSPNPENKLPKWAQQTLRHLRSQISQLEAENAALRAEPGALDGDVFDIHTAVLDPYGAKVPVGAGHIEWTFPSVPGEKQSEKRLSARFVPATEYEHAHININASSGNLRIRPNASNSIFLEMHDD